MRFQEFEKQKGLSLASRTIRNYAGELGADSMDYGMFMKSADLLDKDMLKSLAQHIEDSDTAPREYVMKKIADHNPEIFKKMYGDQEGYLSVMKPQKDLKDDDNSARGMNKYGLAARHKDGKFHSFRHGKHTGSFDSAEELAKHQKELIQNESQPSADAERADAARGMWASSKEIQSRFKTWQDFMNSEDFDEWLDDKFRDEMGEDADYNNFEKNDEYADNVETYGDVDKTPLTPQERQQFANWVKQTADYYAEKGMEGVADIGDDPDMIDGDKNLIPQIKAYLKKSYETKDIKGFADDVSNVEKKFGDEDLLMNDTGYQEADDFSEHATNYLSGHELLSSKGKDYTVKTIRGVLDHIDDDPHIASAMLLFQQEFEGTPLQKKVSRKQATESVSEDAGLTDQQKQGLEAIAKKYKDREGGNGDELARGHIKALTSSGITTDGFDVEEMEAYAKKIGKDWSEWEDEIDDFLKQAPITSGMIDDMIKVLGPDWEQNEKLSAAAADVLDTSAGFVPMPEAEDEPTDKEVRQAKGIAFDKRYKDGNYTGASNTIEKLKKGLSSHPEVADALKRANEELNRITKLAGLGEGASMLPYYKDPKDEKQMTWTFPDAWKDDEALDTPYMSNMSMRQFLDTLGYDSDFEDAGPVDAKEFIARTTQWLQKNINKPSQEIPTTVDRSGGGATMIGGGKPEGWDNRQVKHHNELARKILTKYPEVTHFGFN